MVRKRAADKIEAAKDGTGQAPVRRATKKNVVSEGAADALPSRQPNGVGFGVFDSLEEYKEGKAKAELGKKIDRFISRSGEQQKGWHESHVQREAQLTAEHHVTLENRLDHAPGGCASPCAACCFTHHWFLLLSLITGFCCTANQALVSTLGT